MDINLLRICVTVASFLVFMGVMAYAVHPANRRRFERAAQLPFDDEGTLIPVVAMNGEGVRTLTPTLSATRGDTLTPTLSATRGDTLTPTLSLKGEGANDGQGCAREGIGR